MEKRPLFLGRGRGRGRPTQQSSAATQLQTRGRGDGATWNSANVSQGGKSLTGAEVSKERLEKADKIKESVKKYIATANDGLEDSSEDDEINDDEILNKTLKNYRETPQGSNDDLCKATQYLRDSCTPSASVCLICIASIKHVDAVWSCSLCFSTLHLQCIQKWARDGAAYTFLVSQDNHVSSSDLSWFCPKCRYEFKQSECPTKYYCYCGKKDNPSFDPWLTPHSCGQSCSKPLKPECGHVCLLLCHPGPCPPCPKTVRVSCHCGSQLPVVKRCSAKTWSCGKPCGKQLACAHHNCQSPCHSGDCLPCPKESIHSCLCGKMKSKRPCASPEWQCGKICNKVLSCGHHTCEKVCHSESCGNCPRTGERKCPCGKSSFLLPCTEDIPTCGDTCDKLLSCGRHHCTQQCHNGECGVCRHIVTRTCRCGKREKKVPCSQEFLCEIKCAQLRQCERHQCKRKCCGGNCPPCEQTCNRTLNCRNHKCPSQCHRGPCYPCPRQVDVKCFCGVTVLTLPCGREKVTKPPKCLEPCRHPPDCHHNKRQTHFCHYGPCPPCRQTCGLPFSCGHSCLVRCHDGRPEVSKLPNLKSTVRGLPSSTPASNSESVQHVMGSPCPPCAVPVKISCFGKHEVSSFPCSTAKPFSCCRPCGRQLPCTNHTCQLECHVVTGATDDVQAGKECQVCEEACCKPRPPGCTHQCLLPCHQGDCPKCKQMVKHQCHCGLMVVYVSCSDLTSSNETRRRELLSCKNQCPRNLGCGHRCSVPCHAGPCPAPELCSKKAALRCACLRKKKDFPCHLVQTGRAALECDKDCEALKAKQKKLTTEKEEIKKQGQLKAELEELEWFERKHRGKKRRQRKQQEEVAAPSWLRRHLFTMIMSSVAVVFVSGLFYIAMN